MKKTLLDYLIEQKKGSKNSLKTMIQNGFVTVDSKVVTQANFLVSENQMITIKKKPITYHNFMIPILYEDSNFIAIEKPPGLLTISTQKEKKETAYHIVSAYVKKKSHQKIFILHRLDQDTSGIILFTKNEKLKYEMQKHWDEMVRRRGYYALVEGTDIQESGIIHTWLKETETHFVYSSKDKSGKEAITEYQVIQRYKNHTLLDIHLKTGRKNQIRVHMKEIGHPILGDNKYGKSKTFPRLALHAYQLEWMHPIQKKWILIETEKENIF